MQIAIDTIDQAIKRLEKRHAKLDADGKSHPYTKVMEIRKEAHELFIDHEPPYAKSRMKKLGALAEEEEKALKLFKRIMHKDFYKKLFALEQDIEDLKQAKYSLQMTYRHRLKKDGFF